MNIVRNQHFSGQTVRLDFTHWEGCTFVDCKILVEYGIFVLINNDFERCKLVLSGSAAVVGKVIKLFNPEPKIESFK